MKTVHIMKKITLLFFVFGLMALPLDLLAQKSTLQSASFQAPDGTVRCASDAYNQAMLSRFPKMMGSEFFENEINQTISIIENNEDRGGVIRLPVVVHVVHNGEPIGIGSNISDAQVFSQIQVINEDYRRMMGTRGFGAGVDTGIEFFLAKEDPNCNPTTGINRVPRSSLPNSGVDIDGDIKPKTIWDSSRYLNMWVVQLGAGLLGYATFPGGDPMEDGVVMGYQYFGSNDASGVSLGGVYNLGRTTTHEIGHYLGLLHTFQGGCGAQGDAVADTPPQGQPNYGCPGTPPDTCPGDDDDLIENYMDYSDDICMNMFTAGQNARIQAVLTQFRSSLVNSTVPEEDLPQVSDDGSISVWCIEEECGDVTATVRLANYGTSNLTSATINYDVDGGSNQSLNWTGSLAPFEYELVDITGLTGGSGNSTLNVSVAISNADLRSCNDSDSETFSGAGGFDTSQVNLILDTDNFPEETTWEFRNDSNAIIAQGGPYNGQAATTINESIDLPSDGCYSFTIFDAYADGICCGFGSGSYELRTGNDELIFASNGEFGAEEKTTIVTETLSLGESFFDNNLSVYPNPATSQITIKTRNNELPDSFEIYNVLGQSVTKQKVSSIDELSINTSSFGDGVYFIKIEKDSGSKTIRFVKR